VKLSSPEIATSGVTEAVRHRSGGFTLIELLMVMGIIAIALAALVPAVTSLSKSGGRRAAFNSLIGGIEEARAEAIKSAQATYVVFPTFTSATQSTLDRYNYRSYAIFEDDAANPGNVKQLTDWKSFPTGVSLRAGAYTINGVSVDPFLTYLQDPAALNPALTFTFTPDLSATVVFRCLKFNSNGEVQAPINPANAVYLGVFEGFVSNGSEVATTKDANGAPSAVEYVTVSQFTGRAIPADAVSNPTATPGP
jgi:prepilin-type N-terminal cleavage/methylation domain-containing protein